MTTALFQYCLHLADNALIAGHRNSEWTGHGPILEQDIAISNIALDLIGQARHLYQYAAVLYNQNPAAYAGNIQAPAMKAVPGEIDEDDLAYLRDGNEFFNLLLVEQTNGDWAKTTLRQFFFSAYQHGLYSQLQQSTDSQLAAIATKSLKEVTYHLRWSGEWVIRLGDGTTESHRRMVEALDQLWMFTGEAFVAAPYETELVVTKIITDPALLQQSWLNIVEQTFDKSGLPLPPAGWMASGGKTGIHTEQLGYLLAEMQYLQRAYPNSTW